MNASLSIHDRLAPVEELFFTWLFRVFAAGTLMGSAWIDDAPPLEGAAHVVSIYVALRVALEFAKFAEAAPFENRALQYITAVAALGLLALAFMTIIIFVETLALATAP
jgi:hypothetical protein